METTFCIEEWVWVWWGVGGGRERLWMNQHGNSKRFRSSGRRRRITKPWWTIFYPLCLLRNEGQDPETLLSLSPFVSAQVGWASPLMGHFLFSFHIPSCIKMTNFTYRLQHRHETLSYWANKSECRGVSRFTVGRKGVFEGHRRFQEPSSASKLAWDGPGAAPSQTVPLSLTTSL